MSASMDKAWGQAERDFIDDDVHMDHYDSTQNGDVDESEEVPPDDQEFGLEDGGALRACAGDGDDGLCPTGADRADAQ